MNGSPKDSGRVTQAEVLQHGLNRAALHAESLHKKLTDLRAELGTLAGMVIAGSDTEHLEYLIRELKRLSEPAPT